MKAKSKQVSIEKWAWYQNKYTHFVISTEGGEAGSLFIDGVRIPDRKPKGETSNVSGNGNLSTS